MLLRSILFLLPYILHSNCAELPGSPQQVFEASMTKTKRPQSSPLDSFQNHFASTSRYGERWHESLYPALKEGTRYTTLYNRYAPQEDFHKAVGSPDTLERLRFPSAPDDIQADNLLCFIHKESNDHKAVPFPPPENSSNSLLTHWNFDAASALAVHLLQVLPGDNVLDLCAAPGGKSLSLAQSIWPYLQPDSPTPPMPGAKKGALHSNEVDPARNRRLTDNLSQYLPASLAATGQQKVLRLDGTKGAKEFPLGPAGYDKVLVDAPCSSERHIIHAQEKAGLGRTVEELARWSPSTSKRMAETQVQLLMTALRAVRLGGRVLYATCSISREENEGVVEKAILQAEKERKKGGIAWAVEVEGLGEEVERALEEGWAERTGKGWIALPDHKGNGKWGPLYFCVLTKTKA